MKTKEVEIDGKVTTVYIGDDRKYRVRIECERCGAEAFPTLSRVKNGQGRFCSVLCSNLYEQEHAKYGKEHAYFFWDEKVNVWKAMWYVAPQKQASTTKARWLWENEYGDLPSNQVVTYIDGNPKNCELDNLKVISRSESNSIHLMGHKHSEETKKKISMGHTGKSKWDGFAVESSYPNFSRHLKKFIRDRDEYTCRICNTKIQESIDGRVHHIDGDKNNSIPSNLIYVCKSCHSLIHSKQEALDEILSFRSKLL